MTDTIVRVLRCREKWYLRKGVTKEALLSVYKRMPLTVVRDAGPQLAVGLLAFADYCVRNPEARGELLASLVDGLVSSDNRPRMSLQMILSLNRLVPVAVSPRDLLQQLGTRLQTEEDQRARQIIHLLCGELLAYLAAVQYWEAYEVQVEGADSDHFLLLPWLSGHGLEVGGHPPERLRDRSVREAAFIRLRALMGGEPSREPDSPY